MTYKILKEGDDYKALGINIDGVDIITSLIVDHDGTLTVFTPQWETKRKWRLLFKRPSHSQQQDIWFRKCLAIARGEK